MLNSAKSHFLLALALFSTHMPGYAAAELSSENKVPGTITQLTLADLAEFEHPTDPKKYEEISKKITEETGLEKPHEMPKADKAKLKKAFENGEAGQYSVQELVNAGVFKFLPIANLHPTALSNDEDISIHKRDGKAIEVDNIVWGKKSPLAKLTFGVMHSTEDGFADAVGTINSWNKDCAEGKRSSSTPFVIGRCLRGPDIYVTADFEKRWQRHCSSKLTARDGLVNWNSIGVEMAHSTENKLDYTKAEIVNAARLWTYIQERAGLPDNRIITHGEIQGHLPKDHKSFRTDPEEFDWNFFASQMHKLRENCGYSPVVSNPTEGTTKPQKEIEEELGVVEETN